MNIEMYFTKSNSLKKLVIFISISYQIEYLRKDQEAS